MQLLEGMLALDLTDLKGQFCGKLLRDLGMEVIKVEPPGGDAVRRLGPFKDDVPHLEGSIRFAYLNAGKQSLTLHLERPQGRELLYQLAQQADVLLESYDPSEAERLGLDQATLRRRNPGLLVTSLTGFGLEGPYRDYLCPDIVGFAMGGLMHISGDAALPPVNAPETQSFYFGSVYAALGTMMALWQRNKDDQGRGVDVSIQEAIASQEHLIRAFGFDGESVHRHGSQHEYVCPANIFPAKDGYVYLFVNRQHWKPLLDLWEDHPKELDDPAWQFNNVRKANTEWLNELLSQWTSKYNKDEFVHRMQKHGVPSLPVDSPMDFMKDEQVQYRQAFQPVQHPVLGSYRQIAFPALMDGQREPAAPPPLLGQHTQALLQGRLGLSASDTAVLFSQGII